MTLELATRQNGSDLALHDADLAPRFVVSLDVLKDQVRQLQEFKADLMVENEDYGVIPGTPKPTLLKPGAEKLCMVFGLAPDFRTAKAVEDWEGGFFHYEVECRLISKRTGALVGNGMGSANTKEPRYRWRNASPSCPECGKELRRSKQGDGWYCWTKTGGCGKNLARNEVGPVGKVENPEPYELVNTVLKMAQKRALVAATLVATAASGIFTQDIEDMPSVHVVAGDEPSPKSEGTGGAGVRADRAPAGGGSATRGNAVPAASACADCDTPLKEHRFKDGTCWSPEQLAGFGQRKHGRALCFDHYCAANEARRTAVDQGNVIEGEVREVPAEQPTPRGPRMVEVRSKLYDGWAQLVEEAAALDLAAPGLVFPCSEEHLVSVAKPLRAQVEKEKARRAAAVRGSKPKSHEQDVREALDLPVDESEAPF